MSGLNLQITDFTNEVGVPPLIQIETKELSKLKSPKRKHPSKQKQQHRIHFSESFLEERRHRCGKKQNYFCNKIFKGKSFKK